MPGTNACWPPEAAPCDHLQRRPTDRSNRCKHPPPTPTTAVPPTSMPSSRVSTAPRRRCTIRHPSWPRPMLLQPQPLSPPPLMRNKRSIYQTDTNRRIIRPITRGSTPSNRTVRRCSSRNRRTIPITITPVLDLLSAGWVWEFGCPCWRAWLGQWPH